MKLRNVSRALLLALLFGNGDSSKMTSSMKVLRGQRDSLEAAPDISADVAIIQDAIKKEDKKAVMVHFSTMAKSGGQARIQSVVGKLNAAGYEARKLEGWLKNAKAPFPWPKATPVVGSSGSGFSVASSSSKVLADGEVATAQKADSAGGAQAKTTHAAKAAEVAEPVEFATHGESIFTNGWQTKWIPSEFQAQVAAFPEQTTCSIDMTYRALGEIPPTVIVNPSAKARNLVSKVEKRVEVKVPKVQIEEVPVPFNFTTNRLVYVPTTKTVVREVSVDQVKLVEKKVDVPHPKEVIKIVRVVEVPISVDMVQEVVVYNTIKQTVQRKVEVPVMKTVKKEVQIPQFKEILKEVPVVEIKHRTIEVIKEELEVESVPEKVELVTEELAENVNAVTKDVTAVKETPEVTVEEVTVPQADVLIQDAVKTNTVKAVEWTNVTQEVVEVKEEIEIVEKVVEVVTEKVQIVEVPKYITKYVTKEVELETIREEIVQVTNPKVKRIVKEVADTKVEHVTVDLHKEYLEAKPVNEFVNLVQETVVPLQKTQRPQLVNLIPEPYSVGEKWANTSLQFGENSIQSVTAKSAEERQLTEEVIVKDFVDVVTIQKVEVPVKVTQTNEVQIPYVQIEEKIVEVPRIREEEKILEVCKVYEVERVIEVRGDEKPDLSFLKKPTGTMDANCDTTPKIVEEIRKVEVPVPNFINKTVTVPVYEVVEENIEVPTEVVVEEIIEIPVVVEVEKIVEVPTIQYNDTYVEKVVKKKVLSKNQVGEAVTSKKLATRLVESLNIKEDRKNVKVNVQVAKHVPTATHATKTTTKAVLDLERKSTSEIKKKVVNVKKKVEKLVPKNVERIVQVEVEVLKEVIAERVVPKHKETVKQKVVNVDVYSIEEVEVKKQLKWQSIQPREINVKKEVELKVQQGVVAHKNKEVELLDSETPIVKFVKVPVPVPCKR
eukprot:TRINITY_DN48682_c0_g1_i1.p1 TRINITY_DN48682_c0_g1~~TRINITY_DN48682_c0_g1_i1.p1  ORF type:complete len:945 (+),score=280.66 TRINITY_DN48682_c0_g1_i1:159-2993(+)